MNKNTKKHSKMKHNLGTIFKKQAQTDTSQRSNRDQKKKNKKHDHVMLENKALKVRELDPVPPMCSHGFSILANAQLVPNMGKQNAN